MFFRIFVQYGNIKFVVCLYDIQHLWCLKTVQETLMASVRAETLNIDAGDLNSGKVFSRVASRLMCRIYLLL